MKLHWLTLLVLFYLPVTVGHCSVGVVIDDFNVSNSGFSPGRFASVGKHPVSASTDSGILGGVRKWQVDVTAHQFTDTKIYDGVGGMFGISNGMGQNAEISLRWDGQDNGALLGKFPNQDLSQAGVNNGFLLNLLSADLPTEFEMIVSDSLGTAVVLQTHTGAGVGEFRFSDFTGLNFTDIQSIQLNIRGSGAFDVAINQISAARLAPEPTTVSIWAGLGVLSIMIRRRR
ncbi:MAG: hypothetical protein MK106_13560 [Mariniblastus sp.]|nr:hypothetical protein [Mariniblastus sp.]